MSKLTACGGRGLFYLVVFGGEGVLGGGGGRGLWKVGSLGFPPPEKTSRATTIVFRWFAWCGAAFVLSHSFAIG